MRSRLDMVRLAVGPVSLSLVLAVGSCGSAVPGLAYADDALELVEEGDSIVALNDTVEPEPEPETEQVEPEPEPEPEQVEEVESTVDISPVVDLLMLCAGSLGVLVGYHAFSGFWRVLGGEQ